MGHTVGTDLSGFTSVLWETDRPRHAKPGVDFLLPAFLSGFQLAFSSFLSTCLLWSSRLICLSFFFIF